MCMDHAINANIKSGECDVCGKISQASYLSWIKPGLEDKHYDGALYYKSLNIVKFVRVEDRKPMQD